MDQPRVVFDMFRCDKCSHWKYPSAFVVTRRDGSGICRECYEDRDDEDSD